MQWNLVSRKGNWSHSVAIDQLGVLQAVPLPFGTWGSHLSIEVRIPTT